MTSADIRIGIGGWTYPPWRGDFYPVGLPQARELAYAASRFRTIEINATFYRRQSERSWQTWATAVPEGFQFAVKGSRFVVTRPLLADAGEGIANFFAQGLDRLEDRLGPVLWTLARHRHFDREDMARFLDLLPARLGAIPLRHAIEPRHDSFRDEAFLALARDRDVAVVFGDDEDFPTIAADTASFAYARLQRMRENLVTGYEPSALDSFAAMAKAWQAAGRDSYIFMINGAKQRAPAAALALQDRVMGIVALH